MLGPKEAGNEPNLHFLQHPRRLQEKSSEEKNKTEQKASRTFLRMDNWQQRTRKRKRQLTALELLLAFPRSMEMRLPALSGPGGRGPGAGSGEQTDTTMRVSEESRSLNKTSHGSRIRLGEEKEYYDVCFLLDE